MTEQESLIKMFRIAGILTECPKCDDERFEIKIKSPAWRHQDIILECPKCKYTEEHRFDTM